MGFVLNSDLQLRLCSFCRERSPRKGSNPRDAYLWRENPRLSVSHRARREQANSLCGKYRSRSDGRRGQRRAERAAEATIAGRKRENSASLDRIARCAIARSAYDFGRLLLHRVRLAPASEHVVCFAVGSCGEWKGAESGMGAGIEGLTKKEARTQVGQVSFVKCLRKQTKSNSTRNNTTSSTSKRKKEQLHRRVAFRIAGSVWTFGAVLPFLKSMTLSNMGECLNLHIKNTQ